MIYSTSLLIKPQNNFPHDTESIAHFISELTEKLKVNVVKDIFYNFKPEGITYVSILSESHVSIHTWPEFNSVHLDLVTCKRIDRRIINDVIIQTYGEKTQIKIINTAETPFE